MKDALRQGYGGADYKRMWDEKLLNLKFTRGMALPTY